MLPKVRDTIFNFHKIKYKWIFNLNIKCEVQNFYKILEKIGLSEFGDLLTWMYKKHVKLNNKDVSTHSSLLPMLCAKAVNGAKLVRAGTWESRQFPRPHGPQRTSDC